MDMKEILGDLYTDEVAEKVKDFKLVDLNEGGYVSKAKYEAEKKELLDKYNALNSEKTRADEEYKKSQMTAEELRTKELEDIQNQLRQNKIERNEMEVRSMFSQAGMQEEDFKDMLGTIVKEDRKETKRVAQNMISIFEKQKTAIEQKLKEELLKGTPKPPAGNGDNGVITKEQFSKLSANEMMDFRKNYPDLFSQYIK